MTEIKESATKKKGTTKTEVIIGAGLSKIEKITKEAIAAVGEFSKLQSTAEEQSLKVAEQEQKLASLAVELSETKRRNQIDAELAFKEDKNKLVTEYLTENGLTTIEAAVLNDLKTELAETKAGIKDAVAKEVAIVSNSMKSNYENAAKLKDAEFKATEATNTATIEQQKSQITFLTAQVEMWKKALDDERAASVERAKAGSVGTINVTSAK